MKNYNTLNNNFKSNFLIFGINTKIKNSFLKVFGLNHRLIPDSLTLKQKLKLNLFLTKFDSGKKLKEFVKNNISFFIKIKNYKGNRHKLKYPTRGQRTHTNAKTRKKTIY
jgi:small subunit ribosomal protein S13